MLSYRQADQTHQLLGSGPLYSDGAAALSFYVAASDRAVLAKVSDILKGQGYIGIADTSGQIRYIVDGRHNLYSSAHQIRKLAENSMVDVNPGRHMDEAILKAAIETVLTRLRIPKNLKGYQLLRFILVLAAKDETILRPVNKILYPKTAEHFKISCHQVDRIIRYATKQAQINEGNASLITCLRDEVVDVYRQSCREAVDSSGSFEN